METSSPKTEESTTTNAGVSSSSPYEDKLRLLAEFGFTNTALNEKVLGRVYRTDADWERVIDILCRRTAPFAKFADDAHRSPQNRRAKVVEKRLERAQWQLEKSQRKVACLTEMLEHVKKGDSEESIKQCWMKDKEQWKAFKEERRKRCEEKWKAHNAEKREQCGFGPDSEDEWKEWKAKSRRGRGGSCGRKGRGGKHDHEGEHHHRGGPHCHKGDSGHHHGDHHGHHHGGEEHGHHHGGDHHGHHGGDHHHHGGDHHHHGGPHCHKEEQGRLL